MLPYTQGVTLGYELLPLQGVLLNRNLRRCSKITFGDNFVIFGDISVIFGDNFVTFGDIIPYPDFEAKQPVRRSYLPRTY